MTRLAEEMGDSRLDVSRALNNMQQRGLIILHRGKIIIPDPHDRKNG
jgi:DNA-binding GntR family transcriptional regulator